MPNWVTSKITFDAAKADEVFAAVKSEHSVFDFERLVPSPPNMYHGNLSASDSEDFKVTWSTWCPENWGTKWNACRPTCKVEGGRAVIQFETAWAVPYGVIAAFINRFRIPFELRYFYEAPNFWGIDVFGTDKHDPDDRITRISRRRDNEEDRRALGLELTGRDYDADEEESAQSEGIMGEPIISDVTDPRHPEWNGVFNNMPNPTENDLSDPLFEAIWQTIKRWDVNVPDCYAGYCGANGSHVMLIVNEIRKAYKARQENGLRRPGNGACPHFNDAGGAKEALFAAFVSYPGCQICRAEIAEMRLADTSTIGQT